MNLQRRTIPVAKPLLDEAEADAARRVILSGWVTQGPEVAAFEKEFASYVGAAHACAVSNCTTALHLALAAVGVGPADEVITVSHTFIATANAIRYCDAVPVFVDVGEGCFNIDPDLVEHAISPRTKAILCVHQLGMPCDLASLVEMGKRHGIPVIEDAACAIGSEILWNAQWEKIGRPHADIACFSFHPRKVVTTGDGGMLTTASSDLDRKFRLWRQHSMSVPDTVRHGSSTVVFEEYPELGYNYRMTDVQAAIGRVQLGRLPQIIGQRRRIADLYRRELASIRGITLPMEPNWVRSNWQSFCIGLPDDVSQRDVMQAMLDHGIATRRGVMNIHREPAYQDQGTCRIASELTSSEHAQDHSIILPLYAQMTEEDVASVAIALKHAIRKAGRSTG